MRVLVVDDNQNSLKSLEVVIADLGHDPIGVPDAAQALKQADAQFFPLVITDIRMPGMDGLELLGALKEHPKNAGSDVVLITGHGDMETAVKALRKGAYDYLNKPINARELAAILDRVAEHQALLAENLSLRAPLEKHIAEATSSLQRDLDQARKRLRESIGMEGVVAMSPAMLALFQEVKIFHANPDVPVLLEGETGAGKEIFARAIHFGDRGCDAPLVAINCAAIPAELFEAELFGHEPGAYTGSAPRGAQGKLEHAGSGTLFLDEIAELPLNLQPKLLRVLEERSFYRVGGVKKRPFQARVVCASNMGLEEMVLEKRFRRDLYHRLKVGHLVIPALRDRPEDTLALALHFLRREASKKRKRFQGIHPKAMDRMLAYPWPGNVRELEHAIERAVLTCDGDLLLPEHIAFLATADAGVCEIAHTLSPPSGGIRNNTLAIELPDDNLDLEALTLDIMTKAVEKFDGNKSRAAAYLGISRYQLHRKLHKASVQ